MDGGDYFFGPVEVLDGAWSPQQPARLQWDGPRLAPWPLAPPRSLIVTSARVTSSKDTRGNENETAWCKSERLPTGLPSLCYQLCRIASLLRLAAQSCRRRNIQAPVVS
jgi:hypothetical protein